MSRHSIAIVIGVIVAVATIFVLFDERVSFSPDAIKALVTQSG